MIRSIPNPPMDREDIARFRHVLEQHIRGRDDMYGHIDAVAVKKRTAANAKRIIKNCGGRNPLLGY